MRIAALTLALLCAVISGWTAALAQVQDLGGMPSTHHASPSASHHMPAGLNGGKHDCQNVKSCEHQPKMVHPLLCAACFAVTLETHGIDRVALPAGSVHSIPQRPMRTTALKPRFPPPKAFLSFS